MAEIEMEIDRRLVIGREGREGWDGCGVYTDFIGREHKFQGGEVGSI